MAKKWYPVIDILTCVECGTCVEFCPHGVYDKQMLFLVKIANKTANRFLKGKTE